jgi:hypothetical protein
MARLRRSMRERRRFRPTDAPVRSTNGVRHRVAAGIHRHQAPRQAITTRRGGRATSFMVPVAVSDIMIRCPVFDAEVRTGLDTETVVFSTLPNIPIPMRCLRHDPRMETEARLGQRQKGTVQQVANIGRGHAFTAQPGSLTPVAFERVTNISRSAQCSAEAANDCVKPEQTAPPIVQCAYQTWRYQP